MQGAFDSFAMGNYPYESSYIAGTEQHPLPAWPMRAACSHLAVPSPPPKDLLKVLPESFILSQPAPSWQCPHLHPRIF